ncbi:bleomycin resistance protein [Streptomyces sp. NRRL S-350]|uniref:bleomycin resistance protein n=1 Tax=Streptomyces sp. NRRL S-350 TaxID=1463902 RepID=UPI0004C1EAFC|nr:VOC family protein [Streptomyces sp. NRRL S-350]
MDEYAVPVLPSRDLDETVEFYSRLGFEPRGRWDASGQRDGDDGRQGGGDGRGGYLILVRGTVELHFRHEPGVDPLATAGSCYLRVRDADALHRAWERLPVAADAATGSRLMPVTATAYRMREFALVDRSGNLLRIGSPSAPR